MPVAETRTVVPSPYLAALLTLAGIGKLRRRPLAALVDLGVAAAAFQGISDHTVDRAAGLGGLLIAVRDWRGQSGANVSAWRRVRTLAVGVLGLASLTGTTFVLSPDAPAVQAPGAQAPGAQALE